MQFSSLSHLVSWSFSLIFIKINDLIFSIAGIYICNLACIL